MRVGGAMRKFSAGGRSAPVGKTLMVGTRKIFNRKNRHELESFNKIQRTTTISKKICIKLNEFLPICFLDVFILQTGLNSYGFAVSDQVTKIKLN